MSYELSFSPEFFFAEGEPYDRNDLALNNGGHPTSVWSALLSIPEAEQDEIRAWLGVSDVLYWDTVCETLLDKIRETDTCSDLRSPVEVWIDPDGDYRVKVWD